MLSDVQVIQYLSAEGLTDNNIPNSDDAYYDARHLLLRVIYTQAWNNISPFTTWMTNNRTFFIAASNMSYTIGNKTFSITAGTIYAINPNEYGFVAAAAGAAGIGLATSTFAAWVGVGSTQTFYW